MPKRTSVFDVVLEIVALLSTNASSAAQSTLKAIDQKTPNASDAAKAQAKFLNDRRIVITRVDAVEADVMEMATETSARPVSSTAGASSCRGGRTFAYLRNPKIEPWFGQE